MKFKTSVEPLSVFSVSSLTDIVMLLLIFFLLTSQFVLQTGVKIKLPGSKLNEKSLPSELVVTITAEQQIFAGSEKLAVTPEQLVSKLIELKNKSNQENLIIRADKTVPIELIIKVIDAAKAAQIEKFIIETEKINS
ncbi:MAG: biopolymer transporter ExbD [Ignavibacteriaceae bacterium]|nr:biopolymer transporter ExbD [Ignavibacteriaceae bacterium]